MSTGRAWAALAGDVVLVLVFVLIGRSSHGESDAVAGIWRTAWPFLSGLGVGWLVSMTLWRAAPVPTAYVKAAEVLIRGAAVWASTVLVGMLLRVVDRQGVAGSFVVVAALVLALFLIGWRAGLLVLGRRRARPRRIDLT